MILRFCSTIILVALLSSTKVFAAACCGGGLTLPALIVGDEDAKFSVAISHTQILNDVGPDGIWYSRDRTELNETLRLDAAKIFSDRWQAGASLPVVRRSLAEQSSAGFGDLGMVLGYEVLPDWDYNPWRPHGTAFLDLVAPTGVSNDTSSAPFTLDVRGRGYWSLGAGTVLTKIFGRFDTLASLEVHHSFVRTVELDGGTRATLHPGYGGALTFGSGYNDKKWRLGAALSWLYEDPIATVDALSGGSSSSLSDAGNAQRVATASLSYNYLFEKDYSLSLAVADQTLFGSPANTSLGRSITLSAEKHWLR